MAIRIAISGSSGRMGQAIARCAARDSAFAVSGALEAVGHADAGRELGMLIGEPAALRVTVVTDARTAISQADVLIEFTTPDVTIGHAQLARELQKPMVIGTTGLSDAQLQTLRVVAEKIPVVFSPNMSLGVNVLFELAELAAKRLGAHYDITIVEAHHQAKKDAPSGTAKRLAAVVAGARKTSPAVVPTHAVRAGDIVGDHTLILAGPAERLELTHRAHSREVFAQGALRAAQFAVTQSPGLYDMGHVLRSQGTS